ncbi:MAG: hypothetical protein HRT80_01345 [Henriciella sp.]|nr:hypothetical protein [Henriciella sp.]
MKVLSIASLSALAIVSLMACSATRGGDDSGSVQIAQKDCPKPGPGGLLFWETVDSVIAGQTRLLTPGVASHPGSFEPLPSACLKNLKLSVPEAGVIEQDESGDYTLRILESAPLGERIMLSATYRGQSIRARFSVYDPDQSPLVGYWRQEEGTCDEMTIIRELVFSADGTFSVTWEPFEAYKDYWGTYSYDAESGELSLEIESGNALALGAQSGLIQLSDDALILGTASFGKRFEDVEECRAPFI